ncbi:MAG: glucuronate isomerase [Pseudomonadota bacterium]
MTGQRLTGQAADIYAAIADLPITSPHGHCDPSWFAHDTAFPDPASLLIQPDHYLFRMLYSQGVALHDLGFGDYWPKAEPRTIFQRFADHWHLFLGTPTRGWLEHTLYKTLGIATQLTPESADAVYDEIADCLAKPEWRPRAAFQRLGIETLATTDMALDPLEEHQMLQDDWPGRVVPTFRPDDVLMPDRPDFRTNLQKLAQITGIDTEAYAAFLDALRSRRAAFRKLGATATDHDVPDLMTCWLEISEIEALHAKAVKGPLRREDARQYYGHMLCEMALMSANDGMVMQIHAGSRRSTNAKLAAAYGPNMGSDIPVAIDWVRGLEALLQLCGDSPGFRLIAFTLDESTYARELAPMAGHWPCLRLGPPWWFHDSPNGIRRYFDQVVETAGYFNLAGFNDDTRAFLSIPARHDMWRRGVALHLADQIDRGVLLRADADRLAPLLARDLARQVYRLDEAR